MAKETLNISVTVNPSTPPLVVKDANGNVLADGASVTLSPETVGVADPGQKVCNVSGGVPPYNFATTGSIPAGDALTETVLADGSSDVVLSGTPNAAGAATFSLTISDSATPVQSKTIQGS